MRMPLLSIPLIAAVAVFAAPPVAAVDRDHQKSIEARGYCAQQGRDGDEETLRECCKNMVPTQARQADWDKYVAVCMKARAPDAKRDADAAGAAKR